MSDQHIKLLDRLGTFTPLSLGEMDDVQLMNRIDTKYIFSTDRLPELLEKASAAYRILSIDQHRIFNYNSLYFDTPGFRSYFDHHNGRRPRYKVRFRQYESTGTYFLEVKRKISTDRTRKSRIQTQGIEEILSVDSKTYIAENSPYLPDELRPSMWTLFERITLVGNDSPERITFDLNLKFRSTDGEKSLPFLTIVEVKRDQSRGVTGFMRILKESRIYTGASSKYCLGTILLRSPIKYNRFKPVLLKLNKLENASRSYVPAN